MNLNDKIKKQHIIIEELNKGVDNLLSEQIGLISFLKLLVKGKKYIPKLAVVTALKTAADVLSDKEEELATSELKSEIEQLTKDIADIKSAMLKLEMKRESQLPFKKIRIEFNKKVPLDIPQMKSPEFQRNLISTMYFKVIDLNEDKKYIILKTDSFPDTAFIKLEYKTLEIFKEQKGESNLIYSRYKNPLVKPIEGDSEETFFRIVEIS